MKLLIGTEPSSPEVDVTARNYDAAMQLLTKTKWDSIYFGFNLESSQSGTGSTGYTVLLNALPLGVVPSKVYLLPDSPAAEVVRMAHTLNEYGWRSDDGLLFIFTSPQITVDCQDTYDRIVKAIKWWEGSPGWLSLATQSQAGHLFWDDVWGQLDGTRLPGYALSCGLDDRLYVYDCTTKAYTRVEILNQAMIDERLKTS